MAKYLAAMVEKDSAYLAHHQQTVAALPRDSTLAPEIADHIPNIDHRYGDGRAEILGIAVLDPRGVLREFGLELPEDVEVRVWDSTAELRYLVLPERPAGSEELSEEALAALVTRDAMVGVAKATLPQAGDRG